MTFEDIILEIDFFNAVPKHSIVHRLWNITDHPLLKLHRNSTMERIKTNKKYYIDPDYFMEEFFPNRQKSQFSNFIQIAVEKAQKLSADKLLENSFKKDTEKMIIRLLHDEKMNYLNQN